MINWQEITNERKIWVDKNFPPDVFDHSKLGMIEETGELVHHYLKMEQGIRGTDTEHLEGMRDSVGDLVIYMLGCMWHWNYYPNPGYRYMPLSYGGYEDILFRLDRAVSQVCHDGVQKCIDVVLFYLDKFCELQHWKLEEVVQETWDEVKQRDWVENRVDGGDSQRKAEEEQDGLESIRGATSG